jgi:hypothetical protein
MEVKLYSLFLNSLIQNSIWFFMDITPTLCVHYFVNDRNNIKIIYRVHDGQEYHVPDDLVHSPLSIWNGDYFKFPKFKA